MSISHSPPKQCNFGSDPTLHGIVTAPPCRHSSPLVDIRENRNRPHMGMISRENGSAGAADTPTLILYPHFPRSSINFLDVEATRDKLIIDTTSGSQMDSGSYTGSLKTIRIGYTGDKDGFSSSKPRYQSLQRFTTHIREVASPHSPDRATLDGK